VGITELIEKARGSFYLLSAELFEKQRKAAPWKKPISEHFKTKRLWVRRCCCATDASRYSGLVTVPAIQTKMLHSLAKSIMGWSGTNACLPR